MSGRRPLVAGNWKMNGTRENLAEIEALKAGLGDSSCDVAICPPATLITEAVARTGGSQLMIGGQDCHAEANGAHTGDLAAEMIADAGGALVIVGHSERRADHGESDALVRAKAEAGWRAGLLVILCIGETEAEYRAGETLAVIDRQLAGSVPNGATPGNLVIAYEPVWAIGTGLTPSNDDIQASHAHIRQRLVARFGQGGVAIRVLYGGSVKPANAGEILPLPDVDGALVGGASLKAADFLAIVAAA
ncbi:MAG: triose-phosphate isomerase [Hyphomicrobiales bacterium]|nr:triose-phosphate isomerase [Hyphomicrobiales bacterium]